ncbi:MAG: DNA topoisomerase IB [Solirubrobacterales bacterium]|nr:DNA topoisomerase IB [Solirubrobacterales bacterium]MBV9801031.1 DNA topoisomerase IB [Solirubrobacterales bacterium]
MSQATANVKRRPRLRRADCSGPGLRRVRRGRGFSYADQDDRPITDPQVLERLRALAIPPAWRNVWICPDPMGHLQATGIDAAGRKQYLYHQRWRERRDQQKFDRLLRFGSALPDLRRRIDADLRGSEPTRQRVLACAVRLLDIGLFRVGSEEYADDEGGLGLATICKEHVSLNGSSVVFDYLGKGGSRRVLKIRDPACRPLIATLRRRRGGGEQLLAYRDGRRWSDLRSDDINDYLKEQIGDDFSAKDFRTWNATVVAAVSLAAQTEGPALKTARKREIDKAVRHVAELLGNTPAVARRSYIDPRVFDRYQSGSAVAAALGSALELDAVNDRARARIESAVLDLLRDGA